MPRLDVTRPSQHEANTGQHLRARRQAADKPHPCDFEQLSQDHLQIRLQAGGKSTLGLAPWRCPAKKAQWATMYAKEVEQLRAKVGTHLAELNLLLQLQTSTEYAPIPGIWITT